MTVFAGAVDMALPEGDLRKYARTVLGMLIVLCVVAPLAEIVSGDLPVQGVFVPAPASSADFDEQAARAFEWQAETLARAVPGVKWARAAVEMKDAGGWALPRREGVVEGVTITVSAGSGGEVEAVAPAGVVPAPAGDERELADAVREVVAARFGIAGDRVVVNVAR